jgi:hypothetical protein
MSVAVSKDGSAPLYNHVERSSNRTIDGMSGSFHLTIKLTMYPDM